MVLSTKGGESRKLLCIMSSMALCSVGRMAMWLGHRSGILKVMGSSPGMALLFAYFRNIFCFFSLPKIFASFHFKDFRKICSLLFA